MTAAWSSAVQAPAVVGRERAAHLVPPDLRIHEHAVEIEDDRVDQRSALRRRQERDGLAASLGLGRRPDRPRPTTATGALRPSIAS